MRFAERVAATVSQGEGRGKEETTVSGKSADQGDAEAAAAAAATTAPARAPITISVSRTVSAVKEFIFNLQRHIYSCSAIRDRFPRRVSVESTCSPVKRGRSRNLKRYYTRCTSRGTRRTRVMHFEATGHECLRADEWDNDGSFSKYNQARADPSISGRHVKRYNPRDCFRTRVESTR